MLIGNNTSNIEENIPSITECSMTSDKTLKGVKFSEFSAVTDMLVKAKFTAYSEVLSEISTELYLVKPLLFAVKSFQKD